MDTAESKRRARTEPSRPRLRLWEYRRYWRVDLALAAGLIAVSILLSRQTVDLGISRWFFARAEGGWPDPAQQPWQFLYDLPPILLAIVIPTCMVLLLLSALRVCNRRVRIRSIYLLLALWLGAGLIVEGIFKMNWGRPKPAQLSEFGGWLDFHSPFVPGEGGRGRSFPSGHSSIGYALTAFYFLLRRNRPYWAAASLLGGLAVGSAIGLSRIRVGGHFASDVAWSAAIIFAVNMLVYYLVLNVPAYEDESDTRPHPRRPWGSIVLLLLVPAAIQALVLTISPIYRSICYELPAGAQPDAVRIVTAGTDLELTFTSRAPLRIEGELLGRGLAGAGFDSEMVVLEEHDNRVAELRCMKKGWFFRSGGLVRARVPAAHVSRLTLETSGGDIRLATQSLIPTNTVIDIRSGHLVPPF